MSAKFMPLYCVSQGIKSFGMPKLVRILDVRLSSTDSVLTEWGVCPLKSLALVCCWSAFIFKPRLIRDDKTLHSCTISADIMMHNRCNVG